MLLDAIHRHLEGKIAEPDGVRSTPELGVHFLRTSSPSLPSRVLHKPALCIIAEGAKRVMLGDDVFDYRAGQAVVVTLDLPILGSITQMPFTGMILELDATPVREVMQSLETPPKPPVGPARGITVLELDAALADCVARLVGILDRPDAVRVLRPLLLREVAFHLLTGPKGGEIARMAIPDSHTESIARALSVLRAGYARPMRVEKLAAAARMSLSSFHAHFKSLTSMTPLQYQKQLRLLEARRLMAADARTVADAAREVGYESDSQFSREYARMFGAPPRRDITQLRSQA